MISSLRKINFKLLEDEPCFSFFYIPSYTIHKLETIKEINITCLLIPSQREGSLYTEATLAS